MLREKQKSPKQVIVLPTPASCTVSRVNHEPNWNIFALFHPPLRWVMTNDPLVMTLKFIRSEDENKGPADETSCCGGGLLFWKLLGSHREDEVSRFNPLGAPLKDPIIRGGWSGHPTIGILSYKWNKNTPTNALVGVYF